MVPLVMVTAVVAVIMSSVSLELVGIILSVRRTDSQSTR